MSEFKFACPVCGQHITADSGASGSQLDCPTCFQKIVVPQAPAFGESKYILSASKAGKPRTTALETGTHLKRPRKEVAKTSLTIIGFCMGLLGVSLTAWHLWGDRAISRLYGPAAVETNAGVEHIEMVVPSSPYPVPTNSSWTLDVTNARMPQVTVAGRIHGSGFLCERATLNGGTLFLRQGAAWPPDLGITVTLDGYLNVASAEELSGKTVVITPTQPPPVPRVVLRWRDRQQSVTARIHGGYALKIFFGQAANGKMPGRIYVALPDEGRSYAAGNFEAEIRPARQRRQ
ncbi:MAG TPA: hypothetical protein VEC99_06525 [Clostridia bacterium]|nr:hypothetical protein [Clostridia bacterium]